MSRKTNTRKRRLPPTEEEGPPAKKARRGKKQDKPQAEPLRRSKRRVKKTQPYWVVPKADSDEEKLEQFSPGEYEKETAGRSPSRSGSENDGERSADSDSDAESDDPYEPDEQAQKTTKSKTNHKKSQEKKSTQPKKSSQPAARGRRRRRRGAPKSKNGSREAQERTSSVRQSQPMDVDGDVDETGDAEEKNPDPNEDTQSSTKTPPPSQLLAPPSPHRSYSVTRLPRKINWVSSSSEQKIEEAEETAGVLQKCLRRLKAALPDQALLEKKQDTYNRLYQRTREAHSAYDQKCEEALQAAREFVQTRKKNDQDLKAHKKRMEQNLNQTKEAMQMPSNDLVRQMEEMRREKIKFEEEVRRLQNLVDDLKNQLETAKQEADEYETQVKERLEEAFDEHDKLISDQKAMYDLDLNNLQLQVKRLKQQLEDETTDHESQRKRLFEEHSIQIGKLKRENEALIDQMKKNGAPSFDTIDLSPILANKHPRSSPLPPLTQQALSFESKIQELQSEVNLHKLNADVFQKQMLAEQDRGREIASEMSKARQNFKQCVKERQEAQNKVKVYEMLTCTRVQMINSLEIESKENDDGKKSGSGPVLCQCRTLNKNDEKMFEYSLQFADRIECELIKHEGIDQLPEFFQKRSGFELLDAPKFLERVLRRVFA